MRSLSIGVLALGLAIGAAPALASDLNKPAPDFTLVTFDHQKLTKADLKGKVVVLNYWATWCTPCKAELLVFDSYLRQHPDTDLKIYAVETERSLPNSYLQKMAAAARFSIGTRLSGWGYGIISNGVPTSFVIDRSGVLRHAKAGAFNAQSFDALVTPLLKQAPPEAQTVASAARP